MIRYKDFECDTVEEAVALMRAMGDSATTRITISADKFHVYADDGWIQWDGGECPVPPHTRVQTIERRETLDNFDDVARCARDYDWQHCDGPRDIVKYRIVL